MHLLPLYILFGIIPSFIWLLYYLMKDIHPEPKKTILKVFIWGALATLPVLIIQLWFSTILNQAFFVATDAFPLAAPYLPSIFLFIKWFLVIALTEEIFKYFVVRMTVFNDGVVDEPLDIMLYMVVSALGFAALENTLYLFSPLDGLMTLSEAFQTTVAISFIRFIGATLLHTLCSALLGYFLVKSFSRPKKKIYYTLVGIGLATLLHGLYNFSIIIFREPFNFLVSLSIIAVLSLFIIYDFDDVKKLKGICKL